DEGRQLRPIDDVDRNVLRAGARGDLGVELRPGGGNDGDDVAEVGGERIAEADLKPALAGHGQDLLGNIGVAGKPAHMRPGGAQQSQLGERGVARADKNKDTRGSVEEDREKPHRVVSERPLTSNIFHIIVQNVAQREKYYIIVGNRNRKSYSGTMR